MEGKLLFLSSIKKLNFYKKKGLVKHIKDDEYTILFTPHVLCSDKNPETLIPRKNCCVVTGGTKNLTRHHIVPSFFRRHFPEELKLNFQFVVLINGTKHFEYTIEEQKMYENLGKIYNVEPFKDLISIHEDKIHYIKLARTLLNHGSKIPIDKRILLEKKFMEITGLELSKENLQMVSDKSTSPSNTDCDFGKQLVSKIDDFNSFEMMWLRHFVDVMKPKFLPQDLIAKLK